MVPPSELASLAAPHVSPARFHELLEAATTGRTDREVILLDARNIYETRIGRFMVVRTSALLHDKQ